MDERFADLLTNPKFRRMKKQDRKVKVDERFQSLIKNAKSRSSCKIDKRGRPIQATKTDFHKFYDLSDSENENEKGSKKKAGKKKMVKVEKKENKNKKVISRKISDEEEEKSSDAEPSSEDDGSVHDDESDDEEGEDESEGEASDEDVESEDEESDEDEEENEEETEDESEEDESEEEAEKERRTKKSKKKIKEKLPDYSRGIGNVSSSDDDEEDEEKSSAADDEEVDDDDENKTGSEQGLIATIHPWADQIEPEVPIVEESSRRLAICNLNWDFINASDLMLLCNSFKPQHGIILSVKIYPTDFGVERMKGETAKGPKEMIESTEQETEVSHKTRKQKNKTTDLEQLRQYELNRLRYFVAVVDCDSVETADHIYKNCDGLEFEKTGTKLDFRYIPDEVVFDHEPESVATSLPASGTYKPPRFVDSALSKTDVKLSWDKTSHRRLAVTQVDLRKVKNFDEMEEQMKEYLAPYTSEEDEADEDEKNADPYAGLDWSYVPEYISEKRDVDEMKKLLLEPDEADARDEDDIDMEITWEIGLKDELEEAAKEKQKQMALDKLTPFEQYKQKRKEKRRTKEREKRHAKKTGEKAEKTDAVAGGMDLETFFVGEDDDEQQPGRRKETSGKKTEMQDDNKKVKSKDSLKKRAKKRKRELNEQQLEVNKAILSDPRFSDLASKDFAIDPSAPEFQKRRRKI